MPRTTLILVSLLVVVILGGAGYLWVTHTPITLPGAKVTNVASTNTNASVNTAPSVINAPVNAHGDTPLSGKLTVTGVEVAVSSLQRVATYEGAPADKDQTFLLVYIDPVKPEQVQAVNRALLTDAHLLDGATTYKLLTLKVSSTLTLNDRGFLRFQVPTAAKNLKLGVGTGKDAQSVSLP